MKQVFLALLVVDVFLFIFIYLFFDRTWLLNSQIAFLSSSLVMIASMYSYRNMVNKGVSAGAVTDDGRDTLDKLEDPYALYDEGEDLKEEKAEEEKLLVDVVKEERANLKKNRRSIWETTKDTKASFSFYRLSAYAALVLGFFYLNSNAILVLTPYLLFLSLPPIIILYVLIKNK